ncbi:hypothetical protein OAS19_03470 [Altererythrobacter sp.]|nr:hypothetical protein [Altererythrobacter sp.]
MRELLSAVPPEGEYILYHSAFPVRFVTYTLSNGKLVKIDYGDGLDRMAPAVPYRDR